MPFISVTRLRVRSLLYLPQFVWKALASARQAEHAAGFLDGRIVREAGNTFWTMTAWQDAAAMKAYRDSSTHKAVMAKLLVWCDEASVVHWEQTDQELSDWQEAHRRMVTEGRMSKVNNPSPTQQAKQVAETRLSGKEGRALRRASQQ